MAENDVRRHFAQATDFFISVLERVGPDQWAEPGLGVWSIRDLVGHTSRSLLTVEAYLQQPATAVEADSPAEYFRRALITAAANPGQVAERGREAGVALGDDPLGAVHAIAARVTGCLAAADDDQLMMTSGGGMRLRDYLPTRTFELIVHTLDLSVALRLFWQPPSEAATACLAIANQRILHLGQAGDVLLALTGRRNLQSGFSVV